MKGTGEYDVVVVGGGSAGLSAALVLGRSRRRTLVLDAGEPRNASSSGVHGLFSRDGILPADLLKIGREQLGPYPSVEYRRARVAKVSGSDGAFRVFPEKGTSYLARKLLLATGVVDELPERPGFRELWGRGVFHCPYCNGWEVRDEPLAVYAKSEEALQKAPLILNWSRDLVVCSDGPLGLNQEGREILCALDIRVIEERISRLEGEDNLLKRIIFEDGSDLARKALFFRPPQRQRSELAEDLGCKVAEAELARVVKSDEQGRTTVPGVYVAGDAGNPIQQVVLGVASGAVAAFFVNQALMAEDATREVISRTAST